ncbi:uncharacterized protein LOC110872069 isoform X2 [Helianthus annuus]|nr:uncharacterized protein LOC110872069 isoform X2 [Helianthus annuus]
MAYLYCTPQQTQDMHEYLKDHSPPCEHEMFTKKWGSYAVPVIDGNKCVGVLEVVTDTPRDYSNDITVAKGVIEHAGLQTTMQIDSTMRTYIRPKERSRITFTSPITSYCCLNKYFGLSSICAAKVLERVLKRRLPEGTFRNLCRSVGIPEWPCIRKTNNTRSFVTMNDDLISNPYEIMTTIPSAQEIRTNPFASETSGDTRDWNESEPELEPEPEHAHPSLMAATGDLMDNQDNNIYPARVHLDSMDIDHLRADPLWCENFFDWSGEHTMTSGDSEAWLSKFTFPYNNAPIANHGSMDDIGDFDIDSM